MDGIYVFLGNLKKISNGNFDTVMKVGGNPEFEELSSGISTMVKSILSSSDRISKIIEMSEIPLAAFEYQSSMKYVFLTSGLGELLGLSEEEIGQLYREPERFLAKVQKIMEMPIKEEKGIFQVKDKYIRIHLSLNGEEYLGVVTDATLRTGGSGMKVIMTSSPGFANIIFSGSRRLKNLDRIKGECPVPVLCWIWIGLKV